jgi:hypothetical protein
MAVSLPELFLFRTGVYISSESRGEKAIGERGILMAGDVPYHTIERRGGYVTLPHGVFTCTMERQKKKKNRPIFRVDTDGRYDHHITNMRGFSAGILIHPSKYPHDIVGCIAPGKVQTHNGIDESKKALEEIFQFCGGFGEGRKVRLHVSSL